MKYWLASVTWGVIAAVVMGICGSERFAFAMGCVLGVMCLSLAVAACCVGKGAAEPVKSEDEKTSPWVDTVA